MVLTSLFPSPVCGRGIKGEGSPGEREERSAPVRSGFPFSRLGPKVGSMPAMDRNDSTPPMNRRQFLSTTALAAAAVACGPLRAAERAPFVQTVLGPVPASELGLTLPHEHIMCDFIGAELTGRHRWEPEAVVQKMRPYLDALKERSVQTFVDCTPACIGRDPRVLRTLAQATGLHIVTNTGYYGGANDKFVPKHAYSESAEQLADRWIAEWTVGIEGTGVKPGFVKIGVDEAENGKLSAIDEKLVLAAARTSVRTGLTVTCHTGGGPAGLAAAKRFIEAKGAPGKFIVAHSDGHGLAINQAVAELGAWVSFDGISRRPLDEHMKLVRALTEKHANRLLLSHDNGWYSVGEQGGGKVRDYNYLTDVFVPSCRRAGMAPVLFQQLTVLNPAAAFGCTPA